MDQHITVLPREQPNPLGEAWERMSGDFKNLCNIYLREYRFKVMIFFFLLQIGVMMSLFGIVLLDLLVFRYIDHSNNAHANQYGLVIAVVFSLVGCSIFAFIPYFLKLSASKKNFLTE